MEFLVKTRTKVVHKNLSLAFIRSDILKVFHISFSEKFAFSYYLYPTKFLSKTLEKNIAK